MDNGRVFIAETRRAENVAILFSTLLRGGCALSGAEEECLNLK